MKQHIPKHHWLKLATFLPIQEKAKVNGYKLKKEKEEIIPEESSKHGSKPKTSAQITSFNTTWFEF